MGRGSDDWLSRLPDELLVIILSSLPLRDAARTSVLSFRWTNLWRHSLCLNFDDGDEVLKTLHDPELLGMERIRYINWVNSVLRSHKALTLEEFRICYDLDESNGEVITTWLEFAFARQVQRLELSLLHLYRDHLRVKHLRHFEIKSLKALCLEGVAVDVGDIEFFVHNCPFLEELIIRGPCSMPNIEVCGSSLALKHLEIFQDNPFYRSLKISAPKLTSLKVMPSLGLLLENVPMLVEINLQFFRLDFQFPTLARVLHCCNSQLETLTLFLPTTNKEPELYEFLLMPKLNKLVLIVMTSNNYSITALSCLIRASPHLQEFEFEITGENFSTIKKEVETGITWHSPHQHLKVLKFSGYYGRSTDVALVRYIWENCVALKKIIIYPRCQELDSERIARSYAKQQLEPYVPHHIQLLIL